jgi:hypothetical protein
LSGATALFGRDAELAQLDHAWARRTNGVVTIIAMGGAGKTALLSSWRKRMIEGEPTLEAVFEWSFYSQGARDRSAVSADSFMREALVFFGDAELADSAQSQQVKADRLVALVRRERALLILDGLEPLQYPPTSAGPGALKEAGMVVLLRELARHNLGLCVVTSREPVLELEGVDERLDLSRLDRVAGAELLRDMLEKPGGVAIVDSTLREREEVCEAMQGHALSLLLLGSYIRRAVGDLRRWREIDLRRADDVTQRGHVWRVMDAYVGWLSGGEDTRDPHGAARLRATYGAAAERASEGQMQLAVLRVMGLFDRPTDPGCIAALRREPAIAGLTDALVGLDRQAWRALLSSLEEARLLGGSAYVPTLVRGYDVVTARAASERRPPQGEAKPWPVAEQGPDALVLDAHPLVREYFGDALRRCDEAAWREGHRRLYEHLRESVPHWPEGVEGLQPLYQALVHGCAAGRVQESCDAVYRARINRGARAYSVHQLGAFGADLAAVANFFEQAWDRPSPELSVAARSWVLGVAAFRLRGVGRLSESLEPMRAGLLMHVELEHWTNAAIDAGNLSELELTLGRVGAAVDDATQAVAHADRSEDAFQCLSKRTTLADARLAAGEWAQARALFEQAEAMQAQDQPGEPQLYSLQGHRYCELLLGEAERAAWSESATLAAPSELLASCAQVCERATRARTVAVRNHWTLDIALGHLTCGRAALYAARLHARAPTLACTLTLEQAREQLEAAVDTLREAGAQHHLPKGLLTRAWLHHLCQRDDLAERDLDDAWTLAIRGPMPLHQADIQLHRARLFHDRDALAQAATLIAQLGYHRRLGELHDAQASASTWTPTPPRVIVPPMPAITLRILHISDIHFRCAPDPKSARADDIRREIPRRARVMEGKAWQDNIAELLADGKIDLVCLTGDVADWGNPGEYDLATRFVNGLLEALSLPRSRLFVVPGNHDIDRNKQPDAWTGIRSQSWEIRSKLSSWLANDNAPAGVVDSWRELVLERQAAFWAWVEHGLGRPELLPARSPHHRFGYRIDLGPTLSLPAPVWILGLDTAWLAGDNHDAGKLLLTKDQLMLLGTGADGQPLQGFRLALGHHPLAELADGGEARALLAGYADIYLHGHQHQPITTLSIDPDRHLLELAAGCLFEGTRKDEHPNGFQVIELHLDAQGRPLRAGLRFRTWSDRGGHWHDDGSIYKKATHGRLTLEWPGSNASADAPTRGAKPPSSNASTQAPAGGTKPRESTALGTWRGRLEFLLTEQATAVGPDEKFAYSEKIKEARANIRELEGDA